MRIIIAGWRDATEQRHYSLIFDVLAPIFYLFFDRRHEVTLVHGQCHRGGVDLLADSIAEGWDWRVERHPAQNHPTQDFGPWPGCGPRRNKHMASLGADRGFLFPHRLHHRGTYDSMGRELLRAGIPFEVYPID